ncbi:MAG: hypothetical protein KGQ59_02460 [Bdellovibrionales bacterium]|nr:hypothetical protein [Bdellovibrionales bacterium]
MFKIRRKSDSLAGLTSFGIGALILFSSFGCVGDKDLEDWRRQKLNEDLGELYSAAGIYRGDLTSKQTGEAIGAFEITLVPQVKVVAGSSGDRADGQATLAARIIFQDSSNRLALTALDSYFDQSTGKLEVTLPLQRSGGRVEQVILSGSVANNSLGGELQITGAAELAGLFKLTKDSKQSISEIAEKIRSSKPGTSTELWLGSTQFGQSKEQPVSAIFIESEVSPEEKFLNRFASLQVVQFTLNYGNSFRLVHKDALLDRRTGKLTGKALVERNNAISEVITECESTGTEWKCSHSTEGFGRVATTTVSLQTDPSAIDKLPVDNADSRSILFRELDGRTTLNDNSLKVWLKATYAARTREQELRELFVPSTEHEVSLSLQFELPGHSAREKLVISFEQGSFDERSQTLDARTKLQQGSAVFDVRLRCSPFRFPGLERSSADVQSGTTCQYWSSHRAQPLTIEFP